MRGPLPSGSMIALASFHCSSETPVLSQPGHSARPGRPASRRGHARAGRGRLAAHAPVQEKPEIVALPLVQRCPRHQEPIGDERHY